MEFGLDASVEYQVMRRLHGGREQLDISADKPWCREIAIGPDTPCCGRPQEETDIPESKDRTPSRQMRSGPCLSIFAGQRGRLRPHSVLLNRLPFDEDFCKTALRLQR